MYAHVVNAWHMKEKQHLERKELAIFWWHISLMVFYVHHGLFSCCNKMMPGEHFQKWVIDHNSLTLKLKMHVEWYKREVTDLKVCLSKYKCKDMIVFSWARLGVCIHFCYYIQETWNTMSSCLKVKIFSFIDQCCSVLCWSGASGSNPSQVTVSVVSPGVLIHQQYPPWMSKLVTQIHQHRHLNESWLKAPSMPACSGALAPCAVRPPAMGTGALLSSTLLLKVTSEVNKTTKHGWCLALSTKGF